jgi:hypothetical protein
MADPSSALPPVSARIVAFVGVFLGGGLGAVIGANFIRLQCHGSCDVPIGLGLWVGSLVGALGTSVVAVLGLRALGEWRSIRHEQ